MYSHKNDNEYTLEYDVKTTKEQCHEKRDLSVEPFRDSSNAHVQQLNRGKSFVL